MTRNSDSTLWDAHDELALLIRAHAPERSFQELFAQCPQIFSRTLPMKLHPRQIEPLGRPGRSEPDFIFYPDPQLRNSSYGCIELKRPDSKILTLPRKNIVTLTRDAQTAVSQARAYSQELARQIGSQEQALFLGQSEYLFVIMGLSSELAKKLTREITQSQIQQLLPAGCQILPYDEILSRFEQTLPERIFAFVPADKIPTILIVDLDEVFRVIYERFFADKGFRTLIAQDGESALELLARESSGVDIVMLRSILPDMDGFELTRTIRGQENYKNTPIIITSTFRFKNFQERTLDAGGNAAIDLPAELDEILDVVHRELVASERVEPRGYI